MPRLVSGVNEAFAGGVQHSHLLCKSTLFFNERDLVFLLENEAVLNSFRRSWKIWYLKALFFFQLSKEAPASPVS